MALIKSISGIRGTIGGTPGENLTPVDIVKFTAAYGSWIKEKSNNPKIVIGRDARISGELVNRLVVSTLTALGLNIVDLGLSTTPTVELADLAQESLSHHLRLSRVHGDFDILGAVAGGFLIGIPGVFFALPTIAILKIIFDRIEEMKPWGILLGDETVPPVKKIIQKINNKLINKKGKDS